MESFILNIPEERSETLPNEPYGTLCLINCELRSRPGVTFEEYWRDCCCFIEESSSGVKCFNVHQNHGIRNKCISKGIKNSFKSVMPKIFEIFPDMPKPFIGQVELHSNTWILKEVRFIPSH